MCLYAIYVRSFGVWAHWDSAYKTLDSDFKVHELQLFALLWNSVGLGSSIVETSEATFWADIYSPAGRRMQKAATGERRI